LEKYAWYDRNALGVTAGPRVDNSGS
jgi:hypothetical protein